MKPLEFNTAQEHEKCVNNMLNGMMTMFSYYNPSFSALSTVVDNQLECFEIAKQKATKEDMISFIPVEYFEAPNFAMADAIVTAKANIYLKKFKELIGYKEIVAKILINDLDGVKDYVTQSSMPEMIPLLWFAVAYRFLTGISSRLIY